MLNKNKKLYKVVEVFPEAVVRITRFLYLNEGETVKDLAERCGEEPYTQDAVVVDFGGQAHTESITNVTEKEFEEWKQRRN